MTAIPITALVPIVALLVGLTLDTWVYADASERQRQGDRVSAWVGPLRLETPEAWFLGCLILWVVFFPLYLSATGRNPFDRSRR
jgi:hypothetical protein